MPDCPAISLGRPGIYRFESEWKRPDSHVYVNLFNNKWNTNFRSFWQGNISVGVRLWTIEKYEAEKDITTPITETLTPLLTGLCNYVKGDLPITAEDLSLSRKGVLLTAFGPNPDGEGTLLRVWEDSGQSGELTISFPKQMQAVSAMPIDLRGRGMGKRIKIVNDKLTFKLGAFKPASFLIQTKPAS